MNPSLETHPLMQQLKQTILELTLVSHANIQGYNFAPSENGRTSWRMRINNPLIIGVPHGHNGYSESGWPTGGIDRQGDRHDSYRQKSAEHFARRAERIHTEDQLAALLKAAREALKAWKQTPTDTPGIDPERGSFHWKCQVADATGEAHDVAGWYAISRATVYRYRLKYKGLRAA